MSQSLSTHLAHKLIDWLIAFCGASLLLWFAITQPVFIHTSKIIPQSADIQELKSHVQLLTDGYAPRTINYNNLNDTADYIYSQFSRVGIPEYQTISTVSQEYRNVFLQLGPDTRELFVIGAHYDAKDDSIDSEGNASGIAALIELARNLAKNNNQLKLGVILVAYPLSFNQSANIVNTGSYSHASYLKKNNKKVRLMISLDGVAQTKSVDISQKHSFRFTDLFHSHNDSTMSLVGRLKDFNEIRDLKKDFNNLSSLSLRSYNPLGSFNITQSNDHVNYWDQGYPAVLISDEGNDGSLVEFQHRFSPKDRIDYVKMGMLVDGLLQVVMKAESKDGDKIWLAQRSRNKKAKSNGVLEEVY